MDELLSEIYARFGNGGGVDGRRCDVVAVPGMGNGSPSSTSRRASQSGSPDSDCMTEYSTTSDTNNIMNGKSRLTRNNSASGGGGGGGSGGAASLARRDSQRRQKLKERGKRGDFTCFFAKLCPFYP